MTEPLLAARGMGKRYGATTVLQDVDLTLHAGQMLALVGANGAGKSTLVKIICGAVAPDHGTLLWNGAKVMFRSVADALAAGIAVAHQQVAIVASLTGAENIMLGREPLRAGLIDRAALRAQAQALADRFGARIDLARECGELGLGERKILDIVKALARGPRLLILDEPTASLTLAETRRLFAFLADLKRQGLAILFISHHLPEIFAHCEHVLILRDGRRVHDGPVADISLPEVVRLMVGRVLQDTAWRSHAQTGDSAVALRDMRVGALHIPELTVQRGEVVGVAGVLGAGQTELLERLAGVPHRAIAGSARLGRLAQLPRSVAQAVAHGVVLVADDRLRKALFRGLSVGDNVLAGSLERVSRNGFLSPGRAAAMVRAVIDRLRIKCAGPWQDVIQLSGGNQQKVVFGRWLARLEGDAILLLDNPTEGVDVASKAELYNVIRELAGKGAAILVASAEFSELVTLCDRVYCIADGRLSHCLPRAALSEDRLLTEVN